MVQWLRLHAPNAGVLGSILGWGTQSHMLQLKILQAAIKMPCSQINKRNLFKERKKLALVKVGPQESVCSVVQSCLTLCNAMDCSLLTVLCPWDFPGKNTGVGCHFPFQGIFPTQGANPRLLHWQVGSLPLCCLGAHRKGEDAPFLYFWCHQRGGAGGKVGDGLRAPHSILPLLPLLPSMSPGGSSTEVEVPMTGF